jgi:hypothetical protein
MTICAIAVWRGRDEERLAAGGMLANWALSILLVRANGGVTSEATQWEIFTVDTALLGLYLWIAMRSRRYWPLFAAGFQVLVVVTHLGRAVDPRVSGWAYITAGLVWAYMVLFTIGYGSWTAPRYAGSDDAPTDVPGATRR